VEVDVLSEREVVLEVAVANFANEPGTFVRMRPRKMHRNLLTFKIMLEPLKMTLYHMVQSQISKSYFAFKY
jgi:hypothetical protein